MAEANLTDIYCGLLGVDNKRMLTKVAAHIFANVVGLSVKAGLIVEPRGTEEVPSDLLETADLFSQAFNKAARIGSGEIRYRSLGYEYWQNRRQLSEPYTSLLRRRSQMIPSLYGVLREHRNIISHEHDDPGTTPRIVGLCGTIMSILELAPPHADVDLECLNQQCESAIAAVADGVKSQHRQDRRERGEEISEPLDDEQRSVLEEEIRRLRQQVQFLETQRTRQKLALPSSTRVAKDSRLAKIDDIDRSMHDIVSRLDGIASVTENAFKGIATALDRKLDQFSETVTRAQRAVPPFDDEIPDIPADALDPDEPPKLTLSMAKEKLRELRNRIERETGAKPWENICMMDPIVLAALASASTHGLCGVEDWLELPAVTERYPGKRTVMDHQLDMFGEEMMAIYRRVETSGDHRSQ